MPGIPGALSKESTHSQCHFPAVIQRMRPLLLQTPPEPESRASPPPPMSSPHQLSSQRARWTKRWRLDFSRKPGNQVVQGGKSPKRGFAPVGRKVRAELRRCRRNTAVLQQLRPLWRQTARQAALLTDTQPEVSGRRTSLGSAPLLMVFLFYLHVTTYE